MTTRARGIAWRLVAAALAPFVVWSVWIVATYSPSDRSSAFAFNAGLVVSTVVGAAFIATLPIRASYRVVSLLGYLPVIAVLLVYFTFVVLAVVFGEGP